jgi:hypothetical protein
LEYPKIICKVLNVCAALFAEADRIANREALDHRASLFALDPNYGAPRQCDKCSSDQLLAIIVARVGHLEDSDRIMISSAAPSWLKNAGR